MAGRLRNCRYCRPLLGLMTLALIATILVTTKVWDPLPALAGWWNKFTTLSEPEPVWTVRLGGVPDYAAVMANGEVVVSTRGFVEAYAPANGARVWAHKAHWALFASDVVVMRQRPNDPDADPAPDRGYSVVDPANGDTLWGDPQAIAVWAFSDAILDLTCPESGNCQLRARRHRNDGAVLWAVAVPPDARTVIGASPALAGTRDPAEWFAEAAMGTPGPMPPVIGLDVQGRIQMIDTFAGVRVREVTPPDRRTRVAFSGERLLYLYAERGEAGCRFRLEAFDYKTNAMAWRADGMDLDTASGAGCEQRRDPLGAGNRLVAIRGDSHPTLIASVDGQPTWTGVPGEQVLATDGELAVIVAADRKTVRVIDLLGAEQPSVWTATMGVGPEAAITTNFVIVRDADGGRVVVLSHIGARLLREVKTKALIIGHGQRGIIVASGRRIGYLPV